MTAETITLSPPEPVPATLATLAIDVGGTGLKASVLDAPGRKIVKRVRTKMLTRGDSG